MLGVNAFFKLKPFKLAVLIKLVLSKSFLIDFLELVEKYVVMGSCLISQLEFAKVSFLKIFLT